MRNVPAARPGQRVCTYIICVAYLIGGPVDHPELELGSDWRAGREVTRKTGCECSWKSSPEAALVWP